MDIFGHELDWCETANGNWVCIVDDDLLVLDEYFEDVEDAMKRTRENLRGKPCELRKLEPRSCGLTRHSS